MRKQVFIQQRTPEWYEWRKGKIGGSDISSILEENPYETSLQKWEEMLLGNSKEVTASMKRGIVFEDEARQAACDSLGVKYEAACFEHVSRPYIIASLDGWNEDQGVLEIKVPRASNQELAENGIVPIEYMAQCQQQLLVTNTSDMFFASYDPSTKKIATVLVKRDNEYCDRIEKACEEFYQMLKEGIPPEPSERDYLRFQDVDGIEALIREDRKLLKELKSRLEKNEEKAISQVGGRNAYLGNLKITKSIRKGNIDYSSIDLLQTVDLEKYRKASITSYRIS